MEGQRCLIKSVTLLLLIFKTSQLQNRGAGEILTQCSPPNVCHVTHVICHVSHVICHVSHVMCQMAGVISEIFREGLTPSTCHV